MSDPSITNHYRHVCPSYRLGLVEWELQGCDSQHNDRCPECDEEIEPYMSLEIDEDGNEDKLP